MANTEVKCLKRTQWMIGYTEYILSYSFYAIYKVIVPLEIQNLN